jgi:altronate hydrolase
MSDSGSTQARVLRIDARDNVLVALTDMRKGETVGYLGNDYFLLADVPAKHKFLTQDVSAGGDITMYGVLVGHAVENLRRGELLSTRNIRHAAAAFRDTENAAPHWTPPDVSTWAHKTFLGYHRHDGQVGSRNYWLVLPLVFCENRNLAVLKQAFEEELGFAAPQIYRSQVAELARLYREGKSEDLKKFVFDETQRASASPRVFKNIDGIKFLLHEAGCGCTHEDARNLCGLLAGYIHHPNVAGATVLSLGCQHAQVPMLLE